MTMLIEIFLVLCFLAQPQFCRSPQPVNVPRASATVDPKSVFSLINYAGNCPAYDNLKSQPNYRKLKEYCERPLPDTPRAHEFLSYEVVLCMVLYDAAQHVCKVGHQQFTKDNQSFSGGFSCETMIKQVHDLFVESGETWVSLLKDKFVNISDCEGACVQDKVINPICEYIWKANTLTHQVHVSSAVSADISPAENPQENVTGHGKINKTMTNKYKTSEENTDGLPSTADPHLPELISGSQKTEQVENKITSTNKNDDLAGVKGNSAQSGSVNDVKNNVKEQAHTTGSNVQNDSKKKAQATINTVHKDAKKLAHTADSSTQNSTNKQAHSTNSSVLNIMKKQGHSINSSNQAAEETPHNAAVSPSVNTEGTPESDGDSTGKSFSSDSKSNIASQPENKSPSGVHASDSDMHNQNNDNKEFVKPTGEKNDKVQDTDAGNTQSVDEVQEEDNSHQEEQNKQISKKKETHQEEAETGNTAQFNQLGDTDDSHFYAYFMTMVVICIIGYLVFHNKQKILALALEGRSRRGTRRRPNTSAYRKLDSNLEEAVTSACSTSVTHVIY